MPSTYSILPVMETRISVLPIPRLVIFRTRTRRPGHRNDVCNSLYGIRSELLSELRRELERRFKIAGEAPGRIVRVPPSQRREVVGVSARFPHAAFAVHPS